jgi:hypothetical protein
MVEKTPGRSFRFIDPSGSIAGIKKAYLRINGRGTGRFVVDTAGIDLSAAEQASHRVTVQLASGTYDQSDVRTWEASPRRLEAQR